MKRIESLALRLAFTLVLAFSGIAAASSTPWVIYRLSGGTADGYRPFAGLIADAAGNLYGTTYNGGNSPNCYSSLTFGCGTVFELIRPTSADGVWTESVLYSFQGGTDGAGPSGGVIFDQAGNLYGTTSGGGQNSACPNCGTVFELSPPSTADSSWTETVLHRFEDGTQDGASPMGSLVFDKAGNLYGTTFVGGVFAGTVFELSPPSTSGGSWAESLIYGFTGGTDGLSPESGLIIGQDGALYGTASGGGYLSCGGGGCGVAFRLSPPAVRGGQWTEHVLYTFGSQHNDPRFPSGALVFDGAGNLYGTAAGGGAYKLGAIFELIRPPQGQGGWTEIVLHSFAGGKDGSYPQNNLTLDGQGVLYGVTDQGGGGTGGGACQDGCGTVFKLVLSAILGGAWTEQVLHRFGYQLSDGFAPTLSGLLRLGNVFYGTTTYGGGDTGTCPIGCGTVFRLIPQD